MPSGEHSQVNVTILPQTISIRRHLVTEIGEAGRVASADHGHAHEKLRLSSGLVGCERIAFGVTLAFLLASRKQRNMLTAVLR